MPLQGYQNASSSSHQYTYTSHNFKKKVYGFNGAHTPWTRNPLQEENLSTSMLSPTNPFTQGISSLPRVSEDFILINIYTYKNKEKYLRGIHHKNGTWLQSQKKFMT